MAVRDASMPFAGQYKRFSFPKMRIVFLIMRIGADE